MILSVLGLVSVTKVLDAHVPALTLRNHCISIAKCNMTGDTLMVPPVFVVLRDFKGP